MRTPRRGTASSPYPILNPQNQKSAVSHIFPDTTFESKICGRERFTRSRTAVVHCRSICACIFMSLKSHKQGRDQRTNRATPSFRVSAKRVTRIGAKKRASSAHRQMFCENHFTGINQGSAVSFLACVWRVLQDQSSRTTFALIPDVVIISSVIERILSTTAVTLLLSPWASSAVSPPRHDC